MTKLMSLFACVFFLMMNQGLCNTIDPENDPPVKIGAHTASAQQASFIGGKKNLKKFISTHLAYPEMAREYAIEGSVTISFYVLQDGSIHCPFVEQSLNDDCDKAALNLVNQMPNWEPAMANGLPVPSKKRLTFRFRIQ